MKDDLAKSVIAVPPLARHADLTLNRAANAALIGHLEHGGISTLMYGGNANFYNLGVSEYPAVLDMLLELAAADTWIIPSVGPDFGKMMDQAEALRDRPFPTAMVLPASGSFTVEGVEAGISRFAERLGKPVVLYIKAEGYLTPLVVSRLARRGVVRAIKYAIVRSDPRQDGFLTSLLDLVDRRLIISGIGERPAVIHLRDFGLAGFTSGSVCVAPRASLAILHAVQRQDYGTAERLREAFLPLENCRDAYNPIRVLHEAVSLAGIGDMGPLLPLMSNLEPEYREQVRAAAAALRAFDEGLLPLAA